MKAFKIFSFLLVSLLALASCSKETDEIIATDNNHETFSTKLSDAKPPKITVEP